MKLLLILSACTAGTLLSIPVAETIVSNSNLIDPEDIEVVIELPDVLDESSGLVVSGNGEYLSHNDSGGKTAIYKFNLKGDLIDVNEIPGTENRDWEELAKDEDYLFIGDFGNNYGTRDNLRVYKVPLDTRMAGSNVQADVIGFSYTEQNNYSRRNNHNFDCEAMISKGDSLYLFTKHRGDARTNVYVLPKTPGSYTISTRASFDTGGQITAADYREGQLVLLGYEYDRGTFKPFIWLFTDFDGNAFFSGKSKRSDLPMLAQTEAVAFENDAILFTTEEEEGGKGILYRVQLDKLLPE